MAAASGALRAIEKEILVEALRRFGYDAMDCISEELQRDEETVCAFYEDAVAALRKLLWRSGVRLQAAMAWDSPAMIAAVVKSWGFLKAKVGVESASFAHLGHYLSQPEALAIVQDFTESAQKYKHRKCGEVLNVLQRNRFLTFRFVVQRCCSMRSSWKKPSSSEASPEAQPRHQIRLMVGTKHAWRG